MSSKDDMFAKVILASKPTNGAPTLYTMHLRYPRIFHSEFMTHRTMSRNARSSRAVPVMTMIKEVWNKPFVPWHWGQNQKGMQAGAPITGWRLALARGMWIFASKVACVIAYAMTKLGLHKQIPNRLLEPFSFIDVLASGTSWKNFLHLRNHKDAEPHFQDLARMIATSINGAVPQMLGKGGWHLPYVKAEEVRAYPLATLQKVSVARCARISYTPFDGDGSIGKEIARYELLVGSDPLHASPAEHQAMPDTSYPVMTAYDGVKIRFAQEDKSGNFDPGWVQYRKLLPGEYVPG